MTNCYFENSADHSYAYSYDNYGNRFEKKAYSNNVVLENYTWTRGRLLERIANGSNATIGQYTYDLNGVRYTKTADGVTTTYFYDGNTLTGENKSDGKLLSEKHTSAPDLFFLYNGNEIVGFVENGGIGYFYRKDALGNVVAMYNAAGEEVASYTYDAWGNCTIGTNVDGLADLNPIRYRGYYYDKETQLYYLQTRYYDPQTGRFISPDTVNYLDPESIHGLNLYAYGLNNPVMYVDPTGHWVETVFDLFSLGVSIVEVVINPCDPLAWAGLAGDAFDLIPFVTGVGETIRGCKVVKKGIDLADGVYDSVKVVKAANRAEDFAGGLGKITSLSKTSKGFTISNPSDGIKIHKTFMNNGEPLIDYDTLGNVIKKYRVDGIKGNAMFELKPYNPRNLRNGFKQITNYKRVSKKGYEMFVVLY